MSTSSRYSLYFSTCNTSIPLLRNSQNGSTCSTSFISLTILRMSLPQRRKGNPPPPNNHRRALFLAYIGLRSHQLWTSNCLPQAPQDLPILELVAVLKSHYEPENLLEASRYQFNQRSPKPDETVQEFITALQDLTSKCNFGPFLDD